MKNRFLVLTLFFATNAKAQGDSVQLAPPKKVEWLVGVDAYGGMAPVSLLGGFKIDRSQITTNLHLYQEWLRFGFYYDYYFHKKLKLYAGLGFVNSFVLNDFNKSKQDYTDSLVLHRTHIGSPVAPFAPTGSEVRHLYFINASFGKEFKIYKGLFLNLKVMGVYGINTFYNKSVFSPWFGLQLYYKW